MQAHKHEDRENNTSSTVTEFSVFYILSKRPKTSVDSSIPFLVDCNKNNVERVFPRFADENKLPEWIKYPKTNNLRFVYKSPLQNVECVYYTSRKILKCSGIKYKHIELFDISPLFGILGTRPKSIASILFKAVGILHTTKPWNKNILADIITVDPRINQTMAVCEKSQVLQGKHLFFVSIHIDCSYVRASISCSESLHSTDVTVVMSRLPDVLTSEKVTSIFVELFQIYEQQYDLLEEMYKHCVYTHGVPSVASHNKLYKMRTRLNQLTKTTGIKNLRNELPELFVNNYSRECTVLPIIVSEEDANYIKESGGSIIYYCGNYAEFGRFYTAPDGYFVGLKKNRLGNKDLFPYLVTCYRSDHMSKVRSETYKHYVGIESRHRSSRAKKNKHVPRYLLIKGLEDNYYRQRVLYSDTNLNLKHAECAQGMPIKRYSSFFDALEVAVGESLQGITEFPYCPQLVKQELWDERDENIMSVINERNMTGCGSMLYRYFEELLGVSIHVIVTENNSDTYRLVPRHFPKSPYIWAPTYQQHIVIFENFKSIYGKLFCSYEVLVDQSNRKLFDSNEPIISSIVSKKLGASIKPLEINNNDIIEQLIDDKGKCRVVRTSDGSKIATLTRPFSATTMPDPVCFFHSHTLKLNVTKYQMRLPPIDLLKTSTNNLNYFPNDQSFQHWLQKCQHMVAERLSYENFLSTTDGLQVYRRIIEST